MLKLYVWITNRIAMLTADRERGAAAVEYGLLVALIAAVIVFVVGALGGQVRTAFCTVVSALPGGSPEMCSPTP